MEAWQDKRSIQTMNLRSVFTPEQQRVLERYYDNGMTNQSKGCFQLILQCAQETKLDFSVVRTWVGNKRRKLASKFDQNGQRHDDMPHGLANHTLAGGAGPLGMGPVLSAELAAGRSVQRGPSLAHLLPPASCPSSSSSPSSSSPHSSGGGGGSSSSNNNNNNNDVIVTGIYSVGRGSSSSRLDGASTHSRSSTSKTLPSSHAHAHDTDTHPSHTRPAVRTDHSRVSISLPHSKSPHMQPTPSTSLLYGQARKSYLSRDPAAAAATAIPPCWAKQYGTTQPQPQPQHWALSSPQSQGLPLPSAHAGAAPVHPPPPRSSADVSMRIQQVFTLAGLAEAQQKLVMGGVTGGGGGGGSQEPRPTRRPPRPPDPLATFSIAMETADADDEYSREEELASMGAQMQIGRAQNSGGSSGSAGEGGSGGGAGVTARPSWMDRREDGRGPLAVNSRNQVSVGLGTSSSDLFGEKGCQTQSLYLAGSGGWRGFPLKLLSNRSPLGMANLKQQQIPDNVAAPWLISNSRKRTLQDRTQFSDKDLHSLKRYWDNGMTSLGSVCREKISAASTELSVDSEIVKTWIGNRRRKYRLMGIEIPPPKGGPPTFTIQSSTGPPSPLTPEGPEPKTPEAGEGSELNDEVSVCLSEDGTSDPYQRESGMDQEEMNTAGDPYQRESGMDQEEMNTAGQPENVKIEIIDDDEEDDDVDGDIMTSDMEQMHSLLEFKHEEVQFLENELVNQKQRYFELKSFTRSLLSAVKNNDKEKQQELLASLPQLADDDWEKSPEREREPSTEEDMAKSAAPLEEDMAKSAAPLESSVSEEEGGTAGLL